MFISYYNLEAFDRESRATQKLVEKYGGREFKLKGVRKYIKTLGSAAATYYITLYAIDQAGGSSRQTFQIQVSEETCGKFMLTCDIARIRGESKSDKETILLDIRLPEWPPENPFERYCLAKEELKSNDWIRLYLELTLATTEDRYGDSKFKLDIVNVATDLVPPGLNAKNATFYIRYNDLSKIALGEVSDHIAIVSRRFDEDTGCFVSWFIMSENKNLTFINGLRPFKSKWRLQVKVIRSWKQTPPYADETLEFVLADQT
ncbi:hypothetical protein HID58_044582, partial [Brassica napus]